MYINSNLGTVRIVAGSTYTLQGVEDQVEVDPGAGNVCAMTDSINPGPGSQITLVIKSGSLTFTPQQKLNGSASVQTWTAGIVVLTSVGDGNWTSYSIGAAVSVP